MSENRSSSVRPLLKGLMLVALFVLLAFANPGGSKSYGQGAEIPQIDRAPSQELRVTSVQSGTLQLDRAIQLPLVISGRMSSDEEVTRAMWTWLSGSLSQKLDRAVQGGFNTVIYYIGAGTVYYNSALLPHPSYITPHYDPLANVVEQAHARGLKVHVWWAVGAAPGDYQFRSRYPQWDVAAVYGIPDYFHWLNFSLPEVRRFVGDVALEMAENYDVDVVHLDYIRYFAPPPYNPVDPADFFSPSDIPNTVQSVYQRLKASRPSVKLTAAVIVGQGGSVSHLQNWDDWLAGGYIDQVMPMAYFAPSENDRLQQYLAEWQALPGFERIVPGLSVATSLSLGSTSPKTPGQLITQLEICRAGGADGFSIFNEQDITYEILYALDSYP